jgi:hypothetical protein
MLREDFSSSATRSPEPERDVLPGAAMTLLEII